MASALENCGRIGTRVSGRLHAHVVRRGDLLPELRTVPPQRLERCDAMLWRDRNIPRPRDDSAAARHAAQRPPRSRSALWPGLQRSSVLYFVSHSYYKVFAVIDPHPPYGLEDATADIARVLWEPEHRSFTVKAAASATFYLSEQWNPGWSAFIDGQPARIERWNGAFQAIQLPAGQHRIDFEFKDQGLRIGAANSLATFL